MAGDDRPKTIIEKILEAHTVCEEGGRRLIYIDRLVVADTATGAFRAVAERGHGIRRPDQVMLVPDHFVPSSAPGTSDNLDDQQRAQLDGVQAEAVRLGITLIPVGDPRRGIQHVTSTEQGYAQPGITLAAVDSHTTTQGAMGALALSLGTDLPHALETQCVWVKAPRLMQIWLEGALPSPVTAKDAALALVAMLGANGAAGHAVEFAGPGLAQLSMEARMTLCNMSVEMGAMASIVAPDTRTIAYIEGKPFAPRGADWDRAVAWWFTLASDPGARFDADIAFDLSTVAPMATWGNSADTALPISARVPDPAQEPNAERRMTMERSLAYMGLEPGVSLDGLAIDQVFIGSCTNARIEDLRDAASILAGRQVVVPTLIVPGSGLVKAQAEREGLAAIFSAAGARWGEPGCSMCVSMNGDVVPPGQRCASTSNRNHMGRQGRGSRTHLVSPPMAAAAAVLGRLTDLRNLVAH